MIFSYNWLQSYFQKKLPPAEKLAEILTAHSFESKIAEQKGEDFLLDIDVLPNRAADCFSHFGIAKECAALLGYKFLPQDYPLKKNSKSKTKDYLKLEVEETDLCPRYMGLLMRNVEVKSSPKWLIERLVSIGQKPINNIVDAANFVMLETGQPLHAFDLEKLDGRKIIVRCAKKNEKITTLDNRNLVLNSSVLVIADAKEALAVAGIKGGKRAEISKQTKDIIIEAAVFNPSSIRNTSRSLNLKTDASLRFEQGPSLFLPELAIRRIAGLIQEIAGGEAGQAPVDFCADKPKPFIISVTENDFSRILGEKIRGKEIMKILKSLGFEVSAKMGKNYEVRPPLERKDILIKEDVIEEIGRIYGYEKIPSKIPEGLLIPAKRNDNYFYSDIIKNILVGAGFSEVYNYSFAKIGKVEIGRVEIENPIAIDKKYLRMNLWNGLIINASQNLKYFDEIRIFEIGKVFGRAGETVIEKNKLAGIVVLEKTKEKKQFYEIKGLLETLFSQLGISDFWLDNTSMNEGPMAKIKVGQEIIGYIYHRNAFELDLEKLIELSVEEIEYRPVSKYPAVIRDIAILVLPETKVIEVLDVIENTAGKLLIDTDLFDIYEGEELERGRKNFAFHLIFQSSEKTLSDKEVNAVMEKIIKAVESVEDWEVRR